MEQYEYRNGPPAPRMVAELAMRHDALVKQLAAAQATIAALQAERDTARRRVDELEAREVDVVMLREDLEQRTAELGRVRGERDQLLTCQCEGCDESLEGSAYCERCFAKLRTLVLALPKVEGEIADETILDLWESDAITFDALRGLLQHRQGME